MHIWCLVLHYQLDPLDCISSKGALRNGDQNPSWMKILFSSFIPPERLAMTWEYVIPKPFSLDVVPQCRFLDETKVRLTLLVCSILFAMVTVSPKRQYRGILIPAIPATTGPLWQPNSRRVRLSLSFASAFNWPMRILSFSLLVGFDTVTIESSISNAISIISAAWFLAPTK